jgi:hypothetical protein
MANDDRLSPTLLAEWERLAHQGLRGSLLEQAWCRRVLALTREVRLLWREASPVSERPVEACDARAAPSPPGTPPARLRAISPPRTP